MKRLIPLLLAGAACTPSAKEAAEVVTQMYSFSEGAVHCLRFSTTSYTRYECRHSPSARVFVCTALDREVDDCIETTGTAR